MEDAQTGTTAEHGDLEEEFMQLVRCETASFPQNELCRRIDEGRVTLDDYKGLLRMLFHQTYFGPGTFALAGANCESRHCEARSYLLHHADEEKSHWKWVLNDLKAVGDTRPDPREQFPQQACQAYIAFNFFVAHRQPIARLAIAAVLENLGATHSKRYATKLCTQLRLKPEQASFFYGHSDTDVMHTQDILNVIRESRLDRNEWAWMHHAARMASAMYRRMYDEAVS